MLIRVIRYFNFLLLLSGGLESNAQGGADLEVAANLEKARVIAFNLDSMLNSDPNTALLEELENIDFSGENDSDRINILMTKIFLSTISVMLKNSIDSGLLQFDEIDSLEMKSGDSHFDIYSPVSVDMKNRRVSFSKYSTIQLLNYFQAAAFFSIEHESTISPLIFHLNYGALVESQWPVSYQLPCEERDQQDLMKGLIDNLVSLKMAIVYMLVINHEIFHILHPDAPMETAELSADSFAIAMTAKSFDVLEDLDATSSINKLLESFGDVNDVDLEAMLSFTYAEYLSFISRPFLLYPNQFSEIISQLADRQKMFLSGRAIESAFFEGKILDEYIDLISIEVPEDLVILDNYLSLGALDSGNIFNLNEEQLFILKNRKFVIDYGLVANIGRNDSTVRSGIEPPFGLLGHSLFMLEFGHVTGDKAVLDYYESVLDTLNPDFCPPYEKKQKERVSVLPKFNEFLNSKSNEIRRKLDSMFVDAGEPRFFVSNSEYLSDVLVYSVKEIDGLDLLEETKLECGLFLHNPSDNEYLILDQCLLIDTVFVNNIRFFSSPTVAIFVSRYNTEFSVAIANESNMVGYSDISNDPILHTYVRTVEGGHSFVNFVPNPTSVSSGSSQGLTGKALFGTSLYTKKLVSSKTIPSSIPDLWDSSKFTAPKNLLRLLFSPQGEKPTSTIFPANKEFIDLSIEYSY